MDSQLLVFSKTGVQRAYTSPHNPRAIYFDPVGRRRLRARRAADGDRGARSAAGRRVLHARSDGGIAASSPARRSCLTCHVSASTLDVPGMIARSHTVGEDGNILPQAGSHDVNHQTPHPDRWGGWFVTSEDAAPPYAAAGAPREHHVLGTRQHVEPGVRRLAEQLARDARLPLCRRATSSACWSSITRCTRSTC